MKSDTRELKIPRIRELPLHTPECVKVAIELQETFSACDFGLEHLTEALRIICGAVDALAWIEQVVWHLYYSDTLKDAPVLSELYQTAIPELAQPKAKKVKLKRNRLAW